MEFFRVPGLTSKTSFVGSMSFLSIGFLITGTAPSNEFVFDFERLGSKQLTHGQPANKTAVREGPLGTKFFWIVLQT